MACRSGIGFMLASKEYIRNGLSALDARVATLAGGRCCRIVSIAASMTTEKIA
jgi:hypothetical protein